MQAYERPNGEIYHEIISAKSKQELEERLRIRQREREAAGDKFLGERMLTKNSKCTCGSGKAIKRCCRYIR